MADKKARGKSEDFKTRLMTVSFAKDLFEAREKDNGGKGFGCTLLWPKTDEETTAQIAKGVKEAAVDLHGDKAAQMLKDQLIQSPILDGDGPQAINGKTKQRYAGYAGHWFIRCGSGEDYQPLVIDGKKKELFKPSDCPSGSKVYAVVNAYTWEYKNKEGVTFGVSMVQVVKKAEGDEVLGGDGGGNRNADKFFETIEDQGDMTKVSTGGKGAGALFD